MEKTIKFRLTGARTIYPHKHRLIEVVRNGEFPYVRLFKNDGKIVAEYDNGMAGYIEEKAQNDLNDFSEIEVLIVEETIARIIQIEGTNLIGEFTINEEKLTAKEIPTLKKVCQDLIDKKLATKEEIDERIAYMERCGVTQKQMTNLFRSYKLYPEKYASLIPNPPQTLYQDVSGLVKRVVGYVNVQRNLLFEGDKGVGKNVLTETLAWLYKRPLMEFSMNSQHDNTSLLGGKTIETDENGNNKMGFDLEITIQAAQVGGILVFDEFNTGLAHALSVFNSLLDDRRRITVPGFGVVQADKNFFAIAPQNKDYQGTFENNEATADRFVPIVFPQFTKLKDVLLTKVPQVGLTTINKCDEIFKAIKKMVTDGEVSDRAITIRGFIDACLVLEEDIPLKDALLDNVVNRCNDLDDRKKVLNAINALIG
ncbi:AAA family ATPase (plasmid) [Paenibacillus thiaminolyticus]|uniref:AAA family ATPase n=1 Tax=Paenibacillus thiaminolyticus TaxID=49283 RepID=UPI00232BDC88|nr:AAA family ATPase [Paenibacillus thiaminolyticus]WCF11445.1 AAA family ATPase [Paenibacillus thiaminolyticus]